MALKTKESVFYPLYSIGLSVLGLGVAVYQMVPKEVLTSGFMPCLSDGSADCASRVIDDFGFVTFPLLSAITFAFLIVVYLNLRRSP
jgi:disulfide bond formation protein DsbB